MDEMLKSFQKLDLVDGPHDTDRAPGTGQITCECGNHRERCLFGRQHTWATAYHQGRLIRTKDTFYCHNCGAVCKAEEAQ